MQILLSRKTLAFDNSPCSYQVAKLFILRSCPLLCKATKPDNSCAYDKKSKGLVR
jgi:hypothetical protein